MYRNKTATELKNTQKIKTAHRNMQKKCNIRFHI